MKTYAKLPALALALSAIPLLYACGESPVFPPPDAPVAVAPLYAKVYVGGQRIRLQATLSGPALEAYEAGEAMLWSSDDPFVARVSEDGWVEGLKPGNVIITGGCGVYCATARISVSADTPGGDEDPSGGPR
jgi:hypothetical protein